MWSLELGDFAEDFVGHTLDDYQESLSLCELLDFGGYFLTLLYIADSHFTFHNFFILYAMQVLNSGRILCFCFCIPTVLTM
jgi:hypothetical protein